MRYGLQNLKLLTQICDDCGRKISCSEEDHDKHHKTDNAVDISDYESNYHNFEEECTADVEEEEENERNDKETSSSFLLFSHISWCPSVSELCMLFVGFALGSFKPYPTTLLFSSSWTKVEVYPFCVLADEGIGKEEGNGIHQSSWWQSSRLLSLILPPCCYSSWFLLFSLGVASTVVIWLIVLIVQKTEPYSSSSLDCAVFLLRRKKCDLSTAFLNWKKCTSTIFDKVLLPLLPTFIINYFLILLDGGASLLFSSNAFFDNIDDVNDEAVTGSTSFKTIAKKNNSISSSFSAGTVRLKKGQCKLSSLMALTPEKNGEGKKEIVESDEGEGNVRTRAMKKVAAALGSAHAPPLGYHHLGEDVLWQQNDGAVAIIDHGVSEDCDCDPNPGGDGNLDEEEEGDRIRIGRRQLRVCHHHRETGLYQSLADFAWAHARLLVQIDACIDLLRLSTGMALGLGPRSNASVKRAELAAMGRRIKLGRLPPVAANGIRNNPGPVCLGRGRRCLFQTMAVVERSLRTIEDVVFAILFHSRTSSLSPSSSLSSSSTRRSKGTFLRSPTKRRTRSEDDDDDDELNGFSQLFFLTGPSSLSEQQPSPPLSPLVLTVSHFGKCRNELARCLSKRCDDVLSVIMATAAVEVEKAASTDTPRVVQNEYSCCCSARRRRLSKKSDWRRRRRQRQRPRRQNDDDDDNHDAKGVMDTLILRNSLKRSEEVATEARKYLRSAFFLPRSDCCLGDGSDNDEKDEEQDENKKDGNGRDDDNNPSSRSSDNASSKSNTAPALVPAKVMNSQDEKDDDYQKNEVKQRYRKRLRMARRQIDYVRGRLDAANIALWASEMELIGVVEDGDDVRSAKHANGEDQCGGSRPLDGETKKGNEVVVLFGGGMSEGKEERTDGVERIDKNIVSGGNERKETCFEDNGRRATTQGWKWWWLRCGESIAECLDAYHATVWEEAMPSSSSESGGVKRSGDEVVSSTLTAVNAAATKGAGVCFSESRSKVEDEMLLSSNRQNVPAPTKLRPTFDDESCRTVVYCGTASVPDDSSRQVRTQRKRTAKNSAFRRMSSQENAGELSAPVDCVATTFDNNMGTKMINELEKRLRAMELTPKKVIIRGSKGDEDTDSNQLTFFSKSTRSGTESFMVKCTGEDEKNTSSVRQPFSSSSLPVDSGVSQTDDYETSSAHFGLPEGTEKGDINFISDNTRQATASFGILRQSELLLLSELKKAQKKIILPTGQHSFSNNK